MTYLPPFIKASTPAQQVAPIMTTRVALDHIKTSIDLEGSLEADYYSTVL
jgi:hypothetical protein